MKRLILIITILLIGSSLKSQVVEPDSFYVRIFNLPFNSPYRVWYNPPIQAAPPTSFRLQLQIPIDQIEKKSSPWRDLKAKIGNIPRLKLKVVSLVYIGAWMYVFRDDLRQWSIEHDKMAHVLLSYGLTKYFGWKFTLGFMLSIEATQADIFGTGGRYKDAAGDLLANAAGIALAWRF